ncbi:nitroreductase/quinone reductase family protein [Flexivirga meconopsidis]|uniref:nitroreductase/quinone reductase family protein n=1 Tax=Flexivirga meconopsidis TaxID=2977121 RepID=UPI002240D443|nr:nitroreductase/quinone reductase family protein [Flexivirga meconopsidis]
MTRTYRVGWATRGINGGYAWLTRRGVGAAYRHILTVRGRRSGQPRSTPVDVMVLDGERYLVAPYGVVAWVHNLRASGELELSRGRIREKLNAVELQPFPAVPVIRRYIRDVPVTRPYWEVGVDASDAEIAAIVPKHPVFQLVPPDPAA